MNGLSDEQATNTGQSEFPFVEGDDVLVRVRENGTSGNIVAKFTAECTNIRPGGPPGSSPSARFRLPWGSMNAVTLRYYEAEFEVVG